MALSLLQLVVAWILSAGTGKPARGYSWPPFEPGNEVGRRFEPGNNVGRQFEEGNAAAVKHGATSPRWVNPLAAEIVERTRPTVTWWHPCDEPSIQAWGRVEASIELLTRYLVKHGGDLDADGSVRSAAEHLRRQEARAESLRARLGLDPLSRARLGRDVAAQSLDLARLWAAQEADEAARREVEGTTAGENGSAPSAPAQRTEKDDDAAA